MFNIFSSTFYAIHYSNRVIQFFVLNPTWSRSQSFLPLFWKWFSSHRTLGISGNSDCTSFIYKWKCDSSPKDWATASSTTLLCVSALIAQSQICITHAWWFKAYFETSYRHYFTRPNSIYTWKLFRCVHCLRLPTDDKVCEPRSPDLKQFGRRLLLSEEDSWTQFGF